MPTDAEVRAARIMLIVEPALKLDIQSLKSNAVDDPHSLNSILNEIESSIWLLKAATTVDWSMIPESIAGAAESAMNEMAWQLQEARKFTFAKDKSEGVYRGIVHNVLRNREVLFTSLTPILACSLATIIQAGTYQAKANEQLELAKLARTSIEKILHDQQKHAIQAVVENQRRFFNDEALTHKKYANRWLTATCLAAAAALGIALYASFHPPDSLHSGSLPLTIFAYLPRFIALSIVLYFLSICSRNYRTSRHNFIVNQHRSLALSTFRAFTAASEDPKIRDAILIHAAGAIYSPQPSGYGVDQIEPLPHAAAIDILQRLNSK